MKTNYDVLTRIAILGLSLKDHVVLQYCFTFTNIAKVGESMITVAGVVTISVHTVPVVRTRIQVGIFTLVHV